MDLNKNYLICIFMNINESIKKGKTVAIARFWMGYKIYRASLGPYYNWSDSDAWTQQFIKHRYLIFKSLNFHIRENLRGKKKEKKNYSVTNKPRMLKEVSNECTVILKSDRRII